MAVVRFRFVDLLTFLLLLHKSILPLIDTQLVVKTLVVLSKHVFAEYLPVIIILAAKQPDLLNTPKRPVNGWTNHGFVCVYLPPKDQ